MSSKTLFIRRILSRTIKINQLVTISMIFCFHGFMPYIKHLINGFQAVKPINHDGSNIQTHVQKLHLWFLSDRRELESLGFINIVPWLNHYSTIFSNEPNELTSTLVTKDSNCLNTGQIKNAKNVDFKTKHIWDNHEGDGKSSVTIVFFSDVLVWNTRSIIVPDWIGPILEQFLME